MHPTGPKPNLGMRRSNQLDTGIYLGTIELWAFKGLRCGLSGSNRNSSNEPVQDHVDLLTSDKRGVTFSLPQEHLFRPERFATFTERDIGARQTLQLNWRRRPLQ